MSREDEEHRELPSGGDDEYVVADRDRMRRVSAPEPLGDLLEVIAERRDWRQRLGGGQLSEEWVRVVGEELAGHCEPVRLSGGILVVRVDSQPWATELSYLRDRVRRAANALLGEGLVEEVQITVGAVDGEARGEPGDA